MLFRMIYDEKLAQAAYLIGCQRTGEAIVIDPERDIDRYLELARREGLRITAVAETHIHADFLSGAREFAERTGARLYLSGAGDDEWQYRWLDQRSGGGSYDHRLLDEGDRFRVGNIEFLTLHTPGHTPEHLSFLVTDIGGGAGEPMGIISGDFVFVGDVGRPDLLEIAAGSDGSAAPSARRLYDSLQRFDRLPEYLQVWPGHGAGSACGKALGAVPQTTVGYERRMNAALHAVRGEKESFVEMIIEGQPEPPLYFSRMKRENRDGPALLGDLPKPARLERSAIAGMVQDSGITIVDTRPWKQFRDRHLRGSIHAPLTKAFPTVAGSYVQPEKAVVLVVDQARLDEAVVDMIRIGLDRFAGYLLPEDISALEESAPELKRSLEIDAEQLVPLLDEKEAIVLDVRGVAEYESGHLPGALNIPHTRLADRLQEIPRDTPLFVHCQSGVRSAAATAYLETKGFDPVNVAGGYSRMANVRIPATEQK